MMRHPWRNTFVALGIALLATSCKTRLPVEPTTPEKVRAGDPVFFRPAVPRVPINLESGRYPNLFGGTSTATWIEPVPASVPSPTPAAKPSVEGMNQDDPKMLAEPVAKTPVIDDETRMMAANFNVIACDIDSTFTDSALAYDVVGFRNIQIYLLTPEGQQIMPVQRVIGPTADETPVGALKKFHRKNLLLFPKNPVPVSTPLAGTPPPNMRLVLEGYGSKFYFEWPAQIPVDIGDPKLKDQEWVKKSEKGYKTIRTKERNVIHKFD